MGTRGGVDVMGELTLFVAQFESSNFEFEGFGTSDKAARKSLLRVLRTHCKQRGAKLKEFYYPDEVFVREVRTGDGFIDKEKICAS
jgi:hypothetical protein